MALALDGFPQDRVVPGIGLQINWAAGQSSAPAPSRAAVYVGKKLTSGSVAPLTMTRVKGESDAAKFFGKGSDLHRSLRKHFRIHKGGVVWALPYADGAGTAATGTITITGTATGSGTIECTLAGELVTVGIAKGDTPTVIAGKLVEAVNGRSHLPVIASNAAGVVTFTHKHTGLSTGTATLGVVRYRASASSGSGVTTATAGAALGMGTGTPGVDGATTEAVALTAALVILEQYGIYYVAPCATSAAIIAAVYAHISFKNTAGVGKRCVSILGYTGSLSSAQTLALTPNSELLSIVAQANSEHDTAELVGWATATRQRREGAEKFNMANMIGARSPELLPVFNGADRPDTDDLNAALLDGVSPIATDDVGAYLVKFVTTRSKDASGTVDDQRAADVHRISAVHHIADRLVTKIAVTYGGFFLRPDKRNDDGSVDFTQRVDAKVLTESQFAPTVYSLLNQCAGCLKDVDLAKESVNVTISDQNASRIECTMNLDIVNLASQFGVEINETSAA